MRAVKAIHIVLPHEVGPAINIVNGWWSITFDCCCSGGGVICGCGGGGGFFCGCGGGGGGGGEEEEKEEEEEDEEEEEEQEDEEEEDEEEEEEEEEEAVILFHTHVLMSGVFADHDFLCTFSDKHYRNTCCVFKVKTYNENIS